MCKYTNGNSDLGRVACSATSVATRIQYKIERVPPCVNIHIKRGANRGIGKSLNYLYIINPI